MAGSQFASELNVDKSKKNSVKFISDAPIEDFEGVTNNIDGYVFWQGEDTLSSSKFYFEVDLNTIDTGIGLRNRHMRDNYLETDKYQFARYEGNLQSIRNDTFPILLGIQAGGAWNTQVENRKKPDAKNFQFYGRLIFNTMLKKKFGIGVVPTYLYNSHIRCKDTEYSFTLGSYFQFYVSPVWSVLVEWNPTVTGFRKTYNSASFGIELETGGHFFKILFMNNSSLNPGQFTTGADLPFGDRDWRLGFNITRLIKL